MLTFLVVLLMAGCNLETKTLVEFYGEDLEDVTEILIVNGSTGNEKTMSDKEEIDTFLSKIKDIKFIPEQNQGKRDGFRYSITLYEEHEETFQFGLSQVNGTYYDTQPDIHPIVENVFQNLNIND